MVDSARSRGLYLAIGFAGLALAIASIADMFAPRPYDGIVPVPYSRRGVEVRAVFPGGPSQVAGIRAGDCVVGIGKRLVNSTSDASAELRKHEIGQTVSYLFHRSP
jgi:S1-C subfamily serine protease